MLGRVKLPVLIWREGDVYVADCPAVRIASQGESEEEALKNLREAIELYFEDEALPQFPAFGAAHACEVEVSLAS